MDFIKLTIQNQSILWLNPNKIDAIITLTEEGIRRKTRIEGANDLTISLHTRILINSGEWFYVKETPEEVFAMFPECPF